MRHTSYLSELELYYTYALHCKTFVIARETSFFNLMNEYIDKFHDKEDVIENLKPYLKLLISPEDVAYIKEKY